jgi:hypothetical protein
MYSLLTLFYFAFGMSRLSYLSFQICVLHIQIKLYTIVDDEIIGPSTNQHLKDGQTFQILNCALSASTSDLYLLG